MRVMGIQYPPVEPKPPTKRQVAIAVLLISLMGMTVLAWSQIRVYYPAGDPQAELEEPRWVTILNESGVKNSNSRSPFLDTCVATGRLEVVGYPSIRVLEKMRVLSCDLPDTVGGVYLVRLHVDDRAGGTRCPDGTLFLIGRDDFESLEGRNAEREAAKAALIRMLSRWIER